MTRMGLTLLTLAALVSAGAGGYWIGRHCADMPAIKVAPTATRAPSGPVIYYRDPGGKPIYSLEPTQTLDGRPYRAVLASEDVSFDPQAKSGASDQAGGKRILYYRNPMGLPDISPSPKKDWMGMDYIPVYEGEDDDGSSIKIGPGRLQNTGVKSEEARKRIVASRSARPAPFSSMSAA